MAFRAHGYIFGAQCRFIIKVESVSIWEIAYLASNLWFMLAQATSWITTIVKNESQSEIAILYRQRITQPVISSVYCKRKWSSCEEGEVSRERESCERTISVLVGRKEKLEHPRNDPPLGDERAIEWSAHVQSLSNAKANAWSSSFRLTCKYKRFHSIKVKDSSLRYILSSGRGGIAARSTACAKAYLGLIDWLFCVVDENEKEHEEVKVFVEKKLGQKL